MPRYSKKKKKGGFKPTNLPSSRPEESSSLSRRPAKRMQWTRMQMEAAVRAVESGVSVSINRAARDHGVPPSTLKDRLSGRVVDGNKPGRSSYLTEDEEMELESYLIKSSQLGYGKTRSQVKSMVEKVAVDKGLLRKSRISDGWFKKFRLRHPKLSLRSGDATGHVRMRATSQENLTHYFNLLKEIFEEFDFKDSPERIYNMDESGIPLDPKPPKVLAAKGQKKVRYRCAGIKGQITVLGCCSGTGQALPPFIIFDAKQLNYEWTRGEVPGSRYGLSDTGWTNKGLFHGWLVEHFLLHAVPGRPLLLLVDGHSSHYDPETIKFAKDHEIIIFCLPPHTTHEAQPLDVSFFGPLKINWGHVCHEYYQAAPGRIVTKYNFCELFAKAWMKTCTPETICAGFRRAGIIPFDPGSVKKRFPHCDDAEGMDIRCDKNNCTNSKVNSTTEPGAGSKDSASESPKVTPVFSNEEETLFSRRFEEGYDLYDDHYEQWLSIMHPEALTVADPLCSIESTPTGLAESHLGGSSSETPPQSSSSSSSQTSSSSTSDASSNSTSSTSSSSPLAEDTPPEFESPPLFSSPETSVPETPPMNSADLVSPSNSQGRSPLAPISPNVSALHLGSPLSKYLIPIPKDSKSTRKTGRATVLTSKECLDMLEEKKRKKEKEAEEKEERMRVRKRRKLEREELQKKKKEERLERQQKAIANKKRQPQRRGRSKSKGNNSGDPANNSASTSSCGNPGDPGHDNVTTIDLPVQGTASEPCLETPDSDQEEAYECVFCYGSFCADGEEWVMCACDRWVHERCMEDVSIDENGAERFCPFCLN